MKNAIINKLIRYALSLLQIFVGITAVLGGFGLVSDPSGTKMSVPLELLNNSPFTNYLIPGLVLLVVIGVGHVFAGIVTFFRHRYAGNISVFFGAVLAFYMITEVWFIGLVNFSQPLYFVLGAVELIFGLNLSRAGKSRHQIWIQPTGGKLEA
jgi:hypothetical protein